MEELEKYILRVKKRAQNPAKVFKDIMKSKRLKDLIIELNTQDQLFEKGIDSKGRRLFSEYAVAGNVYSTYTIILKEAKGQKTDVMTLNDTGKFYRSFRVNVTPGGDIVIDANTAKPDGDLADRFGEDIIGLTVKNMDVFIKAFKEELVKYFRDVFFT